MTRKVAALPLALPAAIVAFVTLLTLAPPSDAASSARSGHIVFVNQFFNDCEPECSNKAYDYALNTVRPDGRRGRRLGSCRRGRPCSDADPSYSPDGRRLAFETDGGDSSGPRVMVSRADGSHRRALRLPEDPVASEPTWSPDGRQLAFVVDRDYQPSPGRISQRSDIFIAHADGSHLRALTNVVAREGDQACGRPVRRAVDPTAADPTSSSSDIYTVDPATGAERRLTHRGARSPDWSPDGGRLAFSSFVGRLGHGPSNIFVLNLETRQLRRVGRMVGHDPAWSPDGCSLAYGCGGICRVSARGGRPKLVARPPRGGRAADGSRLISPDWQPRPVGLDRR
jgi:Tol biopolymer transport system component